MDWDEIDFRNFKRRNQAKNILLANFRHIHESPKELSQYSEKELLKIYGIGKEFVAEIKRALRNRGLSLKKDEIIPKKRRIMSPSL